MICLRAVFQTRLKRIPIILSLLVFCCVLPACNGPGLFFINTLAKFGDYKVFSDIAYGEKTEQKLDVYIPEIKNVKLPVVIFFYGGCWGACYTLPKEEYLFVAETIVSHGYVTVIADYRLFPDVRFAEIMGDAKRAVEWVKNNIVNYKGDPDKLFLMGHSSGAHLGSMLVTNKSYLAQSTYQSVQGFIGLAGPYDFLPFTEPYQPKLFGPESEYAASQPVNFVDGNEPALLLLHGEDDRRVRVKNSRSLAAKVQQSDGQAQMRLYPGMGHVDILSSLSIPLRGRRPVVEDIAKFLREKSDRD